MKVNREYIVKASMYSSANRGDIIIIVEIDNHRAFTKKLVSDGHRGWFNISDLLLVKDLDSEEEFEYEII